MKTSVLMPCRALGAFGPTLTPMPTPTPTPGLNALSGIGCVRTLLVEASSTPALLGLNALSGIGCVRTLGSGAGSFPASSVLMPCRALGAFGLEIAFLLVACQALSLNALSGIGCVRTQE